MVSEADKRYRVPEVNLDYLCPCVILSHSSQEEAVAAATRRSGSTHYHLCQPEKGQSVCLCFRVSASSLCCLLLQGADVLARSLEKMGVSSALVTGFGRDGCSPQWFWPIAPSLHTTVHGHHITWRQEPRATVGRECLPVVGRL